jgi:hypothetical protein
MRLFIAPPLRSKEAAGRKNARRGPLDGALSAPQAAGRIGQMPYGGSNYQVRRNAAAGSNLGLEQARVVRMPNGRRVSVTVKRKAA